MFLSCNLSHPAIALADCMQFKCIINQFLKSGCLLSVGMNELWMGWGDFTRSENAISSRHSFYAPDFFLKDEKPWWSFAHFEEVDRADLVLGLREFLFEIEKKESKNHAIPPLKWSEPDFQLFESTFHGLKIKFQKGELRKAVPIVFTEADLNLTLETKAALLIHLLTHTRHLPLQVYGVWNGEEGMLGGTPEVLFQQDDLGIFSTAALAGTRWKGDTQGDLREDPKELEEHRIVVEGISSALSAIGKVTVGELQQMELPTLTHLLTPIFLQKSPSQQESNSSLLFQELIHRLHPTPALGAFPPAAGKLWLDSFQKKLDRRRFGAPFGGVSPLGEMRCLVAIRNIQWEKSKIRLGSGCGVISASILEREWQEILCKIESIKAMFGFSST